LYAKENPQKSRRRSSANANASARETAIAKSKGMVWVYTDFKIHRKSGAYYGNTKHGQFMTESEGQKAGYRASKN